MGEREKGAALDMSKGLDTAMVKNKVLEISLRITGAEDGEIEFDTPLMEAGLTSNSAILLRDELSQELPGINLPVTLVFDYPSIGAMTDLVTTQSLMHGEPHPYIFYVMFEPMLLVWKLGRPKTFIFNW